MVQAAPLTRPLKLRASAGVSLIELLIVVALVAILGGLAAPSFVDTFRRYRVDAVREEMLATFSLARIEAIRRGFNVVVERTPLCASANPVSVFDWSCGWTVYVDTNANNVQDNAEPTLQAVTVPSQVAVIGTVLANPTDITFNRLGQVATLVDQQISIYPQGQAPFNGQLICFSTGSRFRVMNNLATCPAT
jgi:type IV fimbrial biogenesis protein FimT